MPPKQADGRPKSSDDPKKELWTTLLKSVSSGKKLPEKTLLVLGGTPTTQHTFLDSLSEDSSDPRRLKSSKSAKLAPVANDYALGYTYRDVLDADHEDILARLSLYLLSEPSPAFAPLLRPLLTPQSIPQLMVVILLDWAEPWKWLRQLREWIQLLRSLLISLDEESKEVLEEVLIDWRDRNRGPTGADSHQNVSANGEGEIAIPVGPGEWDEALGIPLCVVCQNAEKMDILEKEQAWKDDDFDYVLQFLRTVLLKHGSSLIYTSSSLPGSIRALIHSTLGIYSLLDRQSLKHNVVDRDRILVPPKWDSWGKIRVLRDGFDVEGISTGWSLDLQDMHSASSEGTGQVQRSDQHDSRENGSKESEKGALYIYESSISPPPKDSSQRLSTRSASGLEVESLDTQEFLASQQDVLQRLDTEEEAQNANGGGQNNAPDQSSMSARSMGPGSDDYRVSEHIGPVQTNVGGIQMDADDMLKKILGREADRPDSKTESQSSRSEGKAQNEALANFFSGLMNRAGSKQGPQSPS